MLHYATVIINPSGRKFYIYNITHAHKRSTVFTEKPSKAINTKTINKLALAIAVSFFLLALEK